MGPQPLDLIILGNFEATLQALQAAQPNGCAAETGRTDKQTVGVPLGNKNKEMSLCIYFC